MPNDDAPTMLAVAEHRHYGYTLYWMHPTAPTPSGRHGFATVEAAEAFGRLHWPSHTFVPHAEIDAETAKRMQALRGTATTRRKARAS